MIASVFVMAFALGLSPFGRTSAAEIPIESLVAFQSFRLPLEIVMHRAGTLGIMPVELSYTGYNFDIVTGASALVLWAIMRAGVAVPRTVLWLWNLWGCLATGALKTTLTAMLDHTRSIVRCAG